ncbi:MAG: hypothetical protein ACREFQ_13175, partial [Stellaceae bacterium]
MLRSVWPSMIAAVMFLPAPAYAFDAAAALGPPLGVLAVAAIVLTLLVIAARRRVRRLESESARLVKSLAEQSAVLAGAPLALYRLDAAGDGARSGAGPLAQTPGTERLQGFAAALTPLDRDALRNALDRLKASGAGFVLGVRLAADGRGYDMQGGRVRVGGGESLDLVAVSDASPRLHAEAEAGALRALLDALPRPMWRRRGSDLALVACNRAYAEAVDGSIAATLAERRELAAGVVPLGGRALAEEARRNGTPQTGRYHIVIGGSRQLMELTELPLPNGDVVGFARDLTDLEAKEAELARHVAAHDEVLENIAVAIAIYGSDARLTFF